MWLSVLEVGLWIKSPLKWKLKFSLKSKKEFPNIKEIFTEHWLKSTKFNTLEYPVKARKGHDEVNDHYSANCPIETVINLWTDFPESTIQRFHFDYFESCTVCISTIRMLKSDLNRPIDVLLHKLQSISYL